jgi:polar amino acid transport system permease protein/octopine/nopaline transport system permease protein
MLDWLAFLVFAVMPALLAAVPVTLALTGVAGAIGNALAVPLALARVSHNPLLRLPAYLYITLLRGTPLLVQIYLIYYGIGQLLPGTWVRHSFLWPYLRDGFWYAVFALSLNTAAYSGEILRAAIQAVPRSEIEAARALGLSARLILRFITLPRALGICLPAMSGECILLLKSTSLASTITVMDVLGRAQYIRTQSLHTYEPLLGAGLIYVALVFILTRILNRLERHFRPELRRG